jgi:hypothetical protein
LVAFLSLAVQTKGLWGSQGILPIDSYLKLVAEHTDSSRYWQMPTLFWFGASDTVLVGAAVLGAVAGFLAMIGFAQGWMFALCFLLYLAFTAAGQEFMSFQWDSLLLEAGFLTLFAVPWTWSISTAVQEPHWMVRYLFYLVLFKLMFLSGVVKLLSGDSSWRNLTALSYHYWTQPLPNPISPFMHFMPLWFHRATTGLAFVIELGCPFLMFWPRGRWIAALGFTMLSLSILVSGNFTFFNWLTIFLCFWLIPDAWWSAVTRRLPWSFEILPAASPPSWQIAIFAALMMFSLLWSTRWLYPEALQNRILPFLRSVQSFHISNSYGLFANMTKSRPEIVIEGSLDGVEWREYEFKYKPGSEYRRPPIVAPHQPRLDWQMWFAALGSFDQSPWLQNLFVRIFQNSPDVMSFFAWNPFPETAPKYLRAKLYSYEFTSPSEIFREGRWWTRTQLGNYSPTFSRSSE